MDNDTHLHEAHLENIKYCSAFLGTLLCRKPNDPGIAQLLLEIGQLDSVDAWPYGEQSIVGEAFASMKEALAGPDAMDALTADYQQLFIGPFALKAPPWGSAYLDFERVLFGSSTLELREWMRKNGITTEVPSSEPEDHIGYMLLLLGFLADNRPDLIEEYLAGHLTTWAHRFCELLKDGAKTSFYRGLALLTDTTLRAIAESLSIVTPTRRLYR